MLDRDALIEQLTTLLLERPGRIGVLAVTVESGLEGLPEVARRLETLLGRGELVARTGATTFAIVCHAPSPAARAVTLAARARAVLRAPVRIEGRLVLVRAQTGFAVVRGPGPTAEGLLGHAQASVERRLRAAA